ncbi:MAG: OmpH family outer membrane protein [Desulfovibrio sp.]|nr:OmpH family outer membrane protein [Desulfovibrio sp.]MBI4959335.1 OmpH family outer membrane protein [Desulfovibrio sp.]
MKFLSILPAVLAVFILTACQAESAQDAKPETKTETKTEAKTDVSPAPRMAIISYRDVLTRCEPGAKIVGEIQNKFADQRIQMGLLEQDIRKLQDEVRGSAVKGPKATLLQDKIQKFTEEDQKFRQEVSLEENQRFAPLIESVNKALVAYAKEKGISTIQERTAFIFFENSLDITDDIIKRVNQAQPAQP